MGGNPKNPFPPEEEELTEEHGTRVKEHLVPESHMPCAGREVSAPLQDVSKDGQVCVQAKPASEEMEQGSGLPQLRKILSSSPSEDSKPAPTKVASAVCSCWDALLLVHAVLFEAVTARTTFGLMPEEANGHGKCGFSRRENQLYDVRPRTAASSSQLSAFQA